MLKKIDCVAVPVKTEALDEAISFYTSVGLKTAWQLKRELPSGRVWTLVGMRFPEGGPDLVLQDDPDIKGIDIELRVDDVQEAYRELCRNPKVQWIKEPFPIEEGHVAVFVAPDGNLFVLIGK